MGRIKLFSMVRCRGYMRKVHDGTMIQLYDKNGMLCYNLTEAVKAVAERWNIHAEEQFEELADLSDFCGESVEKTYYERVDEEFVGCVVGYKQIVVTGYIGTDTSSESFDQDHQFCFKKPKDEVKVGVVYFKNNCKRYVLEDDMEEVARANPYESEDER